MDLRNRVLVAAQPPAWRALQTMLTDVVDLMPAHTRADAFKILEHERVDLIVSTIAFDESRMLDFLQAVKLASSTSGIPFLCSRVLPSVIGDDVVISLGDACKECGACDFVDVARLAPDTARDMLRKAVEGCLSANDA
jgi:hypothetical protein